ncbi:hypothetical protein CRUP_025137 [Coryphaenoides rupestris]|nr:hypothetical protein CRUP_025137 [Coryphaenoides rupestris]
MSEYMVVLTRRAIKWYKIMKGRNKVDKNVKLKRYVRKGVPNEHRALVWMCTSGAKEQLDRNPGYYQSVLGAQHDPKLVEAIRTENVLFRKSSNACLQKELFNVLAAYGQHNPAVGYCQGMNFIAGLLLLITMDEEKSFWLLEALLGRILPDYYTPSMLGLKTDQEVLGELVRERVPGVWGVMTEHGVMWSLVVSRWFICLYIDVLPVETVLRIWDCLFYEGSKILFRVALTMIHQHQAAMVEEARSLPDKIFTEPGSLSMATVAKLRATCRARILAEGS